MSETTRVRRARGDRPAPDWEQVYRRNHLERLKRDQPPLDVRAELPGLVARGYEDVPEEEMVRLHWWGLAHDKPKTGTFMVRIKAAGGLVTADQLRGLGRIAAAYGRDELELTTRQGIQLHWVPMDRLESVVAAVEAIGLSTRAAEGDTVRNITGCPVAGLAPDEPFDVTPVIRRIADFFDGNDDYANLPRKHKYTVAACPSQCNAPEVADVALVGTLLDGAPGFALRVGGGMANTPRISRDLGVFVPLDDAVEVLRAVTDTWRLDLRYRTSRARARIKFMMDDYGPEGMRARVEERLGRRLPDGAAPTPYGEADHIGVHPQRQSGLLYAGVPVPSGRVTGTLLTRLADLVDEVGGDVRFTRQQNLVVGNVPFGRMAEVRSRLADLGLPLDRGGAFARSVACTSHQFCNYSVAETKDKLHEVLDRLTARFGGEAIDGLGVHLDGCPHACAQHWVGEIGLQGTTTHAEGSDERIQAYDLSVAGGLGRRTAVGRRLLRRIPTDQVGDVLERLVGVWLEAAPEGTFGDFCRDRTDDELLGIAAGVASEPAADGVTVLVPGPLQRFTGGADELSVQARTVRAVFEALPELGAQVVPDGRVAGAYLLTVADDDIRNLDGLDTEVGPGDVITIVMAMAGG